MAKHEKTNKKRRDDDDLEDMREAFRNHNKRKTGGGGGGSEDWDKLGDGKNNRRVLPRPGSRKFYTEGWTHFNVGPNNRAVRCVDEESMDEERGLPKSGTRCPLCKKFLREQARINSEYAKGDEDGHAEWKRAKDKYVPRHQYYSNVLREDDEGDFEVKILAYGPQIWGQLMNFYMGDDTNIGDFTDPEGGRWMNLKKVKKGRDKRQIEYQVYPADETSDISDAWDAIQEALHDLDAAAGKQLSADEVIAIMKGIDVDKEGRKRDDDDDSDDRSSNRSSRKSKRRDDDDDDDDDRDEDEDDDRDDEDDDQEEEEDEDERPVKVKSSKLAGKMKKKRRDDD